MYHRHRGLSGVELINVQHTQRPWTPCPDEYSFIIPLSWDGLARYAARNHEMHQGKVLCTAPHQGIEMSGGVGAFQVLTFDSHVLTGSLPRPRRSSAVIMPCPEATRVSTRLAHSLAAMARGLMTPSLTALELRRHASDLVQLMAVELFEVGYPEPTEDPCEVDIARRLERDLRYMKVNGVVDTLQACAQRYGLDRYQLYRLFRKRQALSPKRYSLGAAVARARRALARGESPAEAAAAAGFFDQSHLTRHFKQAMGVTPAEYVRLVGSASPGG